MSMLLQDPVFAILVQLAIVAGLAVAIVTVMEVISRVLRMFGVDQ